MTRALACLFALMTACSACSKHGTVADDEGRIELSVDGKPLQLAKGEAEFRQSSDAVYKLALKSHDGQLNRLVIELEAPEAKLGGWVGKSLAPIDVGDVNPRHVKMGVNNNINRFIANGNYYEGLRVAGSVRSATDTQVVVDLDSNFLEFPDSDQGDEATGRVVAVKGTLALPIKPMP